ncbi:MAG: type IV pilin protein [bacterium]
MKITAFGFTVVELLIAVVIIALLTLIAIPNFIASQTRAKVADAQESLQLGMVGLEAYLVDNTDYPPMRDWIGEPNQSKCYEYPMEITTPIAYLAIRPIDPFNKADGNKRAIKYHHPGFGYKDGVAFEAGIYVPRAYPADEGSDATDIFYQGTINTDTHKPATESPVRYAVWSSSPDNRSWNLFDHKPVPIRMRYDPTNGTMSLGFIVRLSESKPITK